MFGNTDRLVLRDSENNIIHEVVFPDTPPKVLLVDNVCYLRHNVLDNNPPIQTVSYVQVEMGVINLK